MDSLAIEVRGLIKRFDDVVAVDGIDLAIKRGGCVGLLGPNGAGKTTTVEILEGLQKPSAGEVRILGRTWAQDPNGIRERIGIALQETHFYERLTVEETVRLFRSFYTHGLETEEAIGLVKLEEKRRAQVKQLSGGQRQRLAVAVALVADPELLFLDEPTTGLDPQSRRALWDVIEALKQRGKTVLLTTHYMDEAERLCDRIIIVDRGKIVADGSPAQLIEKVGGEEIVEIRSQPPLVVEELGAIPGLVSAVVRDGAMVLSVRALHQVLPAVAAMGSRPGLVLEKLVTRRATLDDVFLALTGRSLREGGNQA